MVSLIFGRGALLNEMPKQEKRLEPQTRVVRDPQASFCEPFCVTIPFEKAVREKTRNQSYRYQVVNASSSILTTTRLRWDISLLEIHEIVARTKHYYGGISDESSESRNQVFH